MLCANYGSGQSMDCAAQSMDPCFAQQSMDCLLMQSMDRANEGLEVWISAKPLMHGRSSEAEDSGYKTTDVRH